MDREKMIAVFQKTYGFPSSETDREYLLAFAWFEKGWKAAKVPDGNDPLKPSAQVLIALGSLVVHYEELTSPTGHPADKVAIDSLRNQAEIQEWFDEMQRMAFLPVKR